MNSDTLTPTPVEAPSAAPSLADLLAMRIHGQEQRAATHQAAASSEGNASTVVTMPLLRTGREHFSSIGTASPGGSVNTEGDAVLAAPVAPSSAPKNRVPLVLVHGNGSDGALVQTWINRVLEGDEVYGARFQDNLFDAIHRQQPQAILIQFIPPALDTAVNLATQLQSVFPHIPRVAVGHSKDAPCMLAALRCGVQDFLDMDGPLDTAQHTVLHLLSQPPVVEMNRHRAPITALLSARAGLGCSLIASHLAWYLQQRISSAAAPAGSNSDETAEHLACLLIEMGSPGGDCSIYLNTPGDFSYSDAVSQHRRLDLHMAQSALARHDSGLRLLTQSRQSKTVQPEDAEALLTRLGQYFEHIVLDLGACASSPSALQVLPNASEVWVLCDQSVASVVWTTEMLKQLDAKDVDRARLRLIVCRHDPKLELSAQQIARQLQLPLMGVVPERRRELAQVVNLGALLPINAKREPYVQALNALLHPLIHAHHPASAGSQAAPTSTWSGLLQRLKKH